MTNRYHKLILLTLALLSPTLACRAATRLIAPHTAIPAPTELMATISPVPPSTPILTRTPKPTPQPITCSDDSCLDACIARINEALKTGNFESIGGDYAGKEANLNLVLYEVENGKLGNPSILFVPKEFEPFQQDLNAQQVAWNYTSSLLPPDQLKWISEYYIFTDGPNNTLAWVNTRNIFDRAHWQLGVDIVDAEDPVYFTYTLIHEFGHLITLNTDQIPYKDSYSTWSQNPATCSQFSLPEGCTNPDSYLNLFHQRFWTGIFDEWLETVDQIRVASDDEYRMLVEGFYDKHEDQFIREYAATNIREDVAESFMYFVIEPKPRGNSVVEQKIRFFYDFPELVSLRKQIIQNVCSYTQQ